MNMKLLLRELARNAETLDQLATQHQTLVARQIQVKKDLGPILAKGLDIDNFPFSLDLANGYELRVSDQVFDDLEMWECMRVQKSERMDQDTLFKLLEDIEE